MICVNFLAGANLDNGDPETPVLDDPVLAVSIVRPMSNLEVHHRQFRSQSCDDSERNLISLCAACHATPHHR